MARFSIPSAGKLTHTSPPNHTITITYHPCRLDDRPSRHELSPSPSAPALPHTRHSGVSLVCGIARRHLHRPAVIAIGPPSSPSARRHRHRVRVRAKANICRCVTVLIVCLFVYVGGGAGGSGARVCGKSGDDRLSWNYRLNLAAVLWNTASMLSLIALAPV